MASANYISFSFIFLLLFNSHSLTNRNKNNKRKHTQINSFISFSFLQPVSLAHLNEWTNKQFKGKYSLALLHRGVNLNTDHHHHLVKINGSSNWWHAHSQISQLLMCGCMLAQLIDWNIKLTMKNVELEKMKNRTPFLLLCEWCRRAIQILIFKKKQKIIRQNRRIVVSSSNTND